MREVPNPYSKVGGIDRKVHSLLTLAQLTRELWRARHVAAQLVTHYRDQGQVILAEYDRGPDVGPEHNDRVNERSRHKEYDATADDQRLPVIASPPDRDTGIRDKNDEQHRAQLTDQHPRIGRPHADRDRLSEKRNVLQRGDLAQVEIRSHQKIEQQRERAQTTDRPREPWSAGAEVEMQESDEGKCQQP